MNQTFNQPAAFRRLCVETLKTVSDGLKHWPAAFRRLCVETPVGSTVMKVAVQPPSGGCVLKLGSNQ